MRVIIPLLLLLLSMTGMGHANLSWIPSAGVVTELLRVPVPVVARGTGGVLLLLLSYRLGRTWWARQQAQRRIQLQSAMAEAQRGVVNEVQMLEHAHLKTMVMGIQRALDELIPGQDPEQQQIWLEEARRATQRLLVLVVSLHDQVGGTVPESPVPANLDLTIRDIVQAHAATDRACRYRYEVSGPRQHLPDMVSRPLTLVLYNALINVVRHAHACQVTVQLVYEPGSVCLSVQDNGCGFTPGADISTRGGRGLRDMEQVVSRGQGTVQVASSPGRGTTIHAVMPIPVGKRKEQNDVRTPTPTVGTTYSDPWTNRSGP